MDSSRNGRVVICPGCVKPRTPAIPSPNVQPRSLRLTRIFHSPHETAADCRRRGNEANVQGTAWAQPPHVGSHNRCEISELRASHEHHTHWIFDENLARATPRLARAAAGRGEPRGHRRV